MSGAIDRPHLAHHYGSHHPAFQKSGLGLTIAALGVVFGDIGTSPLYTLRECFVQTGVTLEALSVYGFLSMIFWALTLVATLKYVTFLLRANNRGEGGILALAALALLATTKRPGVKPIIFIIALAGLGLFYGDGLITPAISVISAVEGLTILSGAFEYLVVPLALVILVGLFAVQRYGSSIVGTFAGPITLTWFTTLACLGIYQIIQHPHILTALNPVYAAQFFIDHPAMTMLAFGAIVLSVTGVEAIYSDMGHFGPRPIRRAWFYVVYPCLLLNYFGQGALLLVDPTAIESPFFNLVPAWGVFPLIILATFATICASQAVISGAFSVTHQAIQMGLLPRMRVLHTDGEHRGQVYIPRVNWILMIGVVLLVLTFRHSSDLAHMYGIAVTGAMLCDTLLFFIVMKLVWRRPWVEALFWGGLFFAIDVAFLSSNMLKLVAGGWVPLLIAAVIFVLMYTWKQGRAILVERRRAQGLTLPEFMEKIRAEDPVRVPGTAVYMAFQADMAPYPLLHNYEHNKVLHDRVVLLTVRVEDRPTIDPKDRLILAGEGEGIWHLIIRYGFTERPSVLKSLGDARRLGLEINVSETSFFFGRDRLVMSHRPMMARWRMWLFFWMAHTSTSASDYYKMPRSRVVEIGAQIDL